MVLNKLETLAHFFPTSLHNLLFSMESCRKTFECSFKPYSVPRQCSSQKIVLEGQSGPYNPFLGARYFKKGPMYQYLSNMQKRRSSWKVKEMKMPVYLKLTWSVPFYTQQRKYSVIKQTVQSECMH